IKWVGTTFLVALLGLTSLTMAWIIWQFVLGTAPRTEFIPLFVTDYQRPEVSPLPWREADRQAVAAAKLFTRSGAGENTGMQLHTEVNGDQLVRLEKAQPDKAVVVYLAAHTMVDDSGAIQIVAADSDPYSPKTLMPMQSVLAALKKCPAHNKLLILDVISVPSHPLDLGGTSDAAADLIRKELSKGVDLEEPLHPELTVLAACSPGEPALWSESERQSIFGYYFLKAFADPQADSSGDQALSVAELASYVTKNVDQWARLHRGRPQHPLLTGSKRDFVLAAVDQRRGMSRPKDSTSQAAALKEESTDKKKSADKDKPALKDMSADKDKSAESDKAGAKTADATKASDEGETKAAGKDSARPGDEVPDTYPQ